jgi:hypothetical protein
MYQAYPVRSGDGSIAGVSESASSPLSRKVLPPLSPFLLEHVTAIDLAKHSAHDVAKRGGLSTSSSEEKLAS